MKRALLALTLSVAAAPAFAITFEPFPPGLSFPEPKPTPTIVQSCVDLDAALCGDTRA